MKPPILLIEALKIMDESLAEVNPRAFDIVFCTADKRRDTGGERIFFDRARLVAHRQKASVEAKGKNRSTREKRFPIMIRNITSDEIRRVNIDLIEELNGYPIL